MHHQHNIYSIFCSQQHHYSMLGKASSARNSDLIRKALQKNRIQLTAMCNLLTYKHLLIPLNSLFCPEITVCWVQVHELQTQRIFQHDHYTKSIGDNPRQLSYHFYYSEPDFGDRGEMCFQPYSLGNSLSLHLLRTTDELNTNSPPVWSQNATEQQLWWRLHCVCACVYQSSAGTPALFAGSCPPMGRVTGGGARRQRFLTDWK